MYHSTFARALFPRDDSILRIDEALAMQPFYSCYFLMTYAMRITPSRTVYFAQMRGIVGVLGYRSCWRDPDHAPFSVKRAEKCSTAREPISPSCQPLSICSSIAGSRTQENPANMIRLCNSGMSLVPR